MNIPPPAPGPTIAETQMISALRTAAAASLAGGIIAASGRPHSLQEAIEVQNKVYWAMFPDPSHGRYQATKAATDMEKAHT